MRQDLVQIPQPAHPANGFTPSLTAWDYLRRPETLQDEPDEEPLFATLFAGAGGDLQGFLQFCARVGLSTKGARLLAVNHNPRAMDTCRANHPDVETIDSDLERLDPRVVLRGRQLRALWASAPCQNHSRAAGGKPKRKQERATPDYILDWIAVGRPRAFFEENVWEITDWDDETGNWYGHCQALEAMDYDVEYWCLDAADYGAPQNRKRLILVATRKGLPPPQRPKPTHHNPRKPVPGLKPWRGAIEILRLDEPCPSIFGRTLKDGTPDPYAENTRYRLSRHLRRESPFYEPLAQAVDADTGPVPLLHLVEACPEELWPEWIKRVGDELHIYAAEPFIDQRYGTGVCRTIDRPLGSILTSGTHHALVVPRILGQQGGAESRPIASPLPTESTAGYIRFWTVRCVLPLRGPKGGLHSNPARPIERTLPTIVAGRQTGRMAGVRIDIATPVVLPHHGERPGQMPRIHPAVGPLPTEPATRRLTAGFFYLYTYNGNANITEIERPLTTETTVQRHSLVQLRVNLEDLVVDVGMRPLTVRELADGQTFPPWYVFVGNIGEQTEQIGNAVPPVLAEVTFFANAAALLGARGVTR